MSILVVGWLEKREDSCSKPNKPKNKKGETTTRDTHFVPHQCMTNLVTARLTASSRCCHPCPLREWASGGWAIQKRKECSIFLKTKREPVANMRWQKCCTKAMPGLATHEWSAHRWRTGLFWLWISTRIDQKSWSYPIRLVFQWHQEDANVYHNCLESKEWCKFMPNTRSGLCLCSRSFSNASACARTSDWELSSKSGPKWQMGPNQYVELPNKSIGSL